MKKLFLTITGLVIFSLALVFPLPLAAANVTFDADTTLSLPSGISLTVINGSVVDSLVVNDDSSITLTVGSDTNITIRSTDIYTFSEVGTRSCLPDNYSQVVFNSTHAGTQVLMVTASVACVSTSGGGGGGGGGAAPTVPSNTSVVINNGDVKTESVNVTLTLKATNATLMLIANKADFSDAGTWENYATTKSWKLTEGVGTKTVYAKFRSSSGGESAAVSDKIELVAPTAATSGTVNKEAGGTVSLSDNKASATLPAGAITGSGTLSITPTTSYTAPTGDKKVVGSKVYDLSVTVDSKEVKTFDKKVTLTFTYTDNDVSGINESTLAVYYWSDTTKEWLNLGGTVDTKNNTITVETAHFTKFAVIGEKTAGAGDLVKLACAANAAADDPCKAVYFIGNDGKRYVFPNEKTYKTWYEDFSTVKTISAEKMASYQIGGNVTYRPGVKMVKIETDPKVYAVNKGGELKWVKTESITQGIYGANWNQMIDDISASFFVNYKIGDDIEAAADYNKEVVKSNSPDINTDKGL